MGQGVGGTLPDGVGAWLSPKVGPGVGVQYCGELGLLARQLGDGSPELPG